MNALWPLTLIIFLGGPLAFALARIAIRLQQDLPLAVLASLLIFWHMLALWQGEALLASAVMLLIGVSGLLIVSQWLQKEGVAGRLIKWGLPVLAFFGLALAMSLPVLNLDQALQFLVSYGVACAAAACANFWARHPVPIGKSGLPALGVMGAWLIVRMAVSMIAALD